MEQADLPPEAWAKIAEGELAAARADAAERVKAQLTIADATMKALMLANGGAMIALFTFIGNLVAKSSSALPFNTARLWIAFACFVAGLTLALLCHVCAFVSQDRFYNQAMEEVSRQQEAMHQSLKTRPNDRERQFNRVGMVAYALGIALAACSIIAFMIGCGFALSGVLTG